MEDGAGGNRRVVHQGDDLPLGLESRHDLLIGAWETREVIARRAYSSRPAS